MTILCQNVQFLKNFAETVRLSFVANVARRKIKSFIKSENPQNSKKPFFVMFMPLKSLREKAFLENSAM